MTVPPDVYGDYSVDFGESPTSPTSSLTDSPSVAAGAQPAPDGPSRRPRWQWWPRTLLSKLVAGVVGLVLLLVCMTGSATYYALKSNLQDRLDQQLQSSAGSSVQTMRSLHTTPDESPFSSQQNVYVVVIDGTGSVLGYAPGTNGLLLSSTELKALAGRTTTSPVTVTTTSGQELLVTARTVLVGPLGGTPAPATALIGLSTFEEQRTVRQLVRLEILIGAFAILVAFFATSYGVSFSLRKLKRVTSTAREVAAELSPEGAGLDRRVPVVEEGTEVGQLAESMNTLLAAVETQFAARIENENRMRQFLADASHELRTPLTSIRGYAELARMQRAAGNPDADNLDRIESEGTRMSRLVEDLLMLARGTEEAIPRVELVEAADLVEDAVTGARAANPDRRIDVEPVPSYNLVGDPDQLVRVIRNLLTNAVVHTPTDSPIRVRSFIDGPGLALQVIDGGPGLPPEEAAHVFERFWRADKARTRARGGSGLGLSIVAAIVQAHHGATHFESTVAGGSTVTVWLPGVAG